MENLTSDCHGKHERTVYSCKIHSNNIPKFLHSHSSSKNNSIQWIISVINLTNVIHLFLPPICHL